MALLDLFGPAATTPGAVTVRPSDTRTNGATDTWFKDCTSADLDDGTEIQASWLNAVLGLIRGLGRGNGQTAGAVDIVTQANNDDNILLKAVQHLGQRSLFSYAADTGAANAIAIALSPALAEYKEGLTVRIKAIAAPTGPTTVNINGLGAKNVMYNATPLTGGEWGAGQIIILCYDGTNFQLVWIKQPGAPVYLQAARTYYVNGSTGNDANDGTTATVTGGHGPFATLQRAADEAVKFNLNGFNININVADGTYARFDAKAVSGSGNVIWTGNTTTPANCHISISSTNSPAIGVFGTTHLFNGFKVTNTLGNGITLANGTVSQLNIMEYGACGAAAGQIVVNYGSTLRIDGTTRITGGAGYHISAYQGSVIETVNVGAPGALTLVGTPAFGVAFISADILSSTVVVFASVTGAATGVRYKSTLGSIIWTNGGGANYYPGNAAGVAVSGQYG